MSTRSHFFSSASAFSTSWIHNIVKDNHSKFIQLVTNRINGFDDQIVVCEDAPAEQFISQQGQRTVSCSQV